MSELTSLAPEILAHYPADRRRSGLLPLLMAAQDRDGYVTRGAVDEIGEIVGIAPAEVLAVASFYHMLHLEPKGRHVISVCHNLACTLLGGEKVIAALESHLGIPCGQTSQDGEFTLERAECLAACDLAPMLQLDYEPMVGPLSPEEAVALVEEVRSGPAPAPEPAGVPVEPAPAAPGHAGLPEEAVSDVEGRWPEGEAPVAVEAFPPPSPVQPAGEEEADEPAPLVDTIALSEADEALMHREIGAKGRDALDEDEEDRR